jgi:hypothetical protein
MMYSKSVALSRREKTLFQAVALFLGLSLLWVHSIKKARTDDKQLDFNWNAHEIERTTTIDAAINQGRMLQLIRYLEPQENESFVFTEYLRVCRKSLQSSMPNGFRMPTFTQLTQKGTSSLGSYSVQRIESSPLAYVDQASASEQRIPSKNSLFKKSSIEFEILSKFQRDFEPLRLAFRQSWMLNNTNVFGKGELSLAVENENIQHQIWARKHQEVILYSTNSPTDTAVYDTRNGQEKCRLSGLTGSYDENAPLISPQERYLVDYPLRVKNVRGSLEYITEIRVRDYDTFQILYSLSPPLSEPRSIWSGGRDEYRLVGSSGEFGPLYVEFSKQDDLLLVAWSPNTVVGYEPSSGAIKFQHHGIVGGKKNVLGNSRFLVFYEPYYFNNGYGRSEKHQVWVHALDWTKHTQNSMLIHHVPSNLLVHPHRPLAAYSVGGKVFVIDFEKHKETMLEYDSDFDFVEEQLKWVLGGTALYFDGHYNSRYAGGIYQLDNEQKKLIDDPDLDHKYGGSVPEIEDDIENRQVYITFPNFPYRYHLDSQFTLRLDQKEKVAEQKEKSQPGYPSLVAFSDDSKTIEISVDYENTKYEFNMDSGEMSGSTSFSKKPEFVNRSQTYHQCINQSSNSDSVGRTDSNRETLDHSWHQNSENREKCSSYLLSFLDTPCFAVLEQTDRNVVYIGQNRDVIQLIQHDLIAPSNTKRIDLSEWVFRKDDIQHYFSSLNRSHTLLVTRKETLLLVDWQSMKIRKLVGKFGFRDPVFSKNEKYLLIPNQSTTDLVRVDDGKLIASLGVLNDRQTMFAITPEGQVDWTGSWAKLSEILSCTMGNQVIPIDACRQLYESPYMLKSLIHSSKN